MQKSNLRIVRTVPADKTTEPAGESGVQPEDIREVHSHHMAIQQCLEYLDKYDWKRWWKLKTIALSAKHIHQHRSKHIVAIASKLAADLFELDNDCTEHPHHENNYTRFLVVQREDAAEPVTGADKASVNFHTDHSVVKVLPKCLQNCGRRYQPVSETAKLPRFPGRLDTAFMQIWNLILLNNSIQ